MIYVVHDVARAIASKDPQRFVVKEAVGLQHVELQEWQWMDECRNLFTQFKLLLGNSRRLFPRDHTTQSFRFV